MNHINDVAHSSISSQELRVGGTQARWSDLSAVTQPGMTKDARPLAKTAGNYRFSDISSMTHN